VLAGIGPSPTVPTIRRYPAITQLPDLGSMDVIDLTGLGSSLNSAGELNPKGKLNAHSVGWQTSGGNTYIYANTSSSNGSADSANMKIELLGKITLSSSNILHL
jgi:hypothetical protein